MEKYLFYDNLLSRIGNLAIDKVAKSVQSDLMQLTEWNLSGDSGLNNTWEEYCAQIQGEDSFHLDEYLETIRNYIKKGIQVLGKEEKMAIMCKSCMDLESLGDWEKDIEIAQTPDDIIFREDVIVAEIEERISDLAREYESHSLKMYLFDNESNEEE
ncbi:MAG: hypothetical protein K1X54_11755 [Flavobacteriales bacterium]|nr:hypothetical protein [Flavobacteriales bacterium]